MTSLSRAARWFKRELLVPLIMAILICFGHWGWALFLLFMWWVECG